MNCYPNAKACLYPFASLTVAPSGVVRLCSSTSHALGDLRHQSFQEIWLGDELEKIRQQMLKPEEPSSCLRCYDLERRQLISKRQHFNQRRELTYGSSAIAEAFSQTSARPQLLHLDISFSNKCNLACAMCSSEYSSKWFTLDQRAIDEGLGFRSHLRKYQESFSLCDSVIDEIVEFHGPTLRSIIIKGGEPLIDKGCLRFLKRLSQSQSTRSDLIINIQTNGTLLSDDFFESIQDLKLEVGLSIDGIDDIYEWVRGYRFDPVTENIKRLHQCESVISIALDFTTTAFNLFQLPKFASYALALSQDLTKVSKCNFSSWAKEPHASPLGVRADDRLICAQELQEVTKLSPRFFDYSHEIVEVLAKPQSGIKELETLRNWTDFMNSVRGQRIQDLEPRLLPSLERA